MASKDSDADGSKKQARSMVSFGFSSGVEGAAMRDFRGCHEVVHLMPQISLLRVQCASP